MKLGGLWAAPQGFPPEYFTFWVPQGSMKEGSAEHIFLLSNVSGHTQGCTKSIYTHVHALDNNILDANTITVKTAWFT